MSLSRAFTTRRARANHDDVPKVPERSASQVLRHKISAPVQLIHTTNMLSYNAPDIPKSAGTHSAKSDGESDIYTNTDSTPPTSPDIAPHERSDTPEPKQAPSYFTTPPPSSRPSLSASDIGAAPAIPKRSPSHTKKNSIDAINRRRSTSRISRDSDQSMSIQGHPTFSRSASISTRASSVSHISKHQSAKHLAPLPQSLPAPAPAPTAAVGPKNESHPFGQELAQVSELAEEYGISSRMDALDEEVQYMKSRGLFKFTPDDYLGAIHGLSLSFFPERTQHRMQQPPPLWI